MTDAEGLASQAQGAAAWRAPSQPEVERQNSHRAGELFPGASWWVGLVILTMPIREVSLGYVGGAYLRIGDIILFLAIGSWVLSGVQRGRLPIQWNRLDVLLALFVLLYATSLIWSNQSYHGEVRALKLCRNLGMYLLLVNYLSSDARSGFRVLAMCFVVSGLMQGAAFLVSIAQAGGFAALNEIFSASTLLSNDIRLSVVKTNNGAGWFLRGAAGWMPLAMFFGLGGAYLLRNQVGALAVRGAAVILGFLTVLTMSRTAWVGMAAGLLVREAALGLRAITKRTPLLMGTAAVILVAGWYPMIASLVRRRFPESVLADNSVTERFYYFEMAWQSFLDRPFLGGGVAGISADEFVVAHSVYLQVLGELGLVGMLMMSAIFWLWVSFLIRVWRIAKQARDRELRATAAAMLGLTTFFLVSFIFAYDLEGGEPWIAMAMSSALFSSAWAKSRRRAVQLRRLEIRARRQARLVAADASTSP